MGEGENERERERGRRESRERSKEEAEIENLELSGERVSCESHFKCNLHLPSCSCSRSRRRDVCSAVGGAVGVTAGK